MGHTTGPWMIEPCSDTDEVRNIVSEYEVMPDGMKRANWIAELDAQIDFDSDVDEQLERLDANARLIAAAPELLEALKIALNTAEALIESELSGTTFYVAEWHKLEPCRAAIKKAEG